MHELSVCLALATELEAIARREGGRVLRVRIGLGPLGGVEPELLAAAFPIAAAGTLAEGAELVIEPCPIRIRCSVCGTESDAPPNRLVCSACGDWRTDLISGDELLLTQVEIDVSPVRGPVLKEISHV